MKRSLTSPTTAGAKNARSAVRYRVQTASECQALANRRLEQEHKEIADIVLEEEYAQEEEDLMIGKAASLWEQGCIKYDWFTPPGEKYADVKSRHPEQQRWSPQSTTLLNSLVPLYEKHYGMTPWEAGWRWEFQKNNHRWFPPQSIVDEYTLDAQPTVSLPGKFSKLTSAGLSSPQAMALLEALPGPA